MSEIILSNEQTSVARYPENGVIRVNGGPGSGKTLVAVKRAIFLAKDYKYAEKDDKVLFLFYNKSLERTIKKLFESEKDYEKVKDKIEIRSIDSFFVKEYINANNQEFFAYVKKANNDKDFVTSYDKERKERIENILLAKKEELKKYQDEVLGNARKTMSEDDVAYIEEDLRSPCTQEIAEFRAFAELVEKADDEIVVIDTAPTGHTLLLLDSTLSYHQEVQRTQGQIPESVKNLLLRLRAEETEVLIVSLAEATPFYMHIN